MKYEIKGIKKEETIKEYKIVNGVIVVTYLDDNVKTLPYTAENEKLVVDKMLQQASYRESELYQAYMSCRTKKDINGLSTLVQSTGFVSLLTLYTSPMYAFTFIPVLIAILSVFNSSKKTDDESRDIEKYHLYLEMKEKLEKILSSELKSGTNNALSNLNINTIDKFSLRDLKRISKELKAMDSGFQNENYRSHLEQNSHEYAGKFAKSKSMIR